MWKPEEIRAAEYIEAEGVCGELGDDHDVDRRWTEAAYTLAEKVTANRSDYGPSPDCEPLPVDEAVCCEMGAEYERDDTFLVWEDDMGWLLSLNTIDGAWAVYGANLPENAWPTTRPQLRSLLASLAALGGGT